jgi:hypothetical protein
VDLVAFERAVQQVLYQPEKSLESIRVNWENQSGRWAWWEFGGNQGRLSEFSVTTNLTKNLPMASNDVHLLKNVLVINVDNITDDWKTYVLSFTPHEPGPLVSQLQKYFIESREGTGREGRDVVVDLYVIVHVCAARRDEGSCIEAASNIVKNRVGTILLLTHVRHVKCLNRSQSILQLSIGLSR